MVDDLAEVGQAGTPPRARWQHRWHPYDDYQNVHHEYIEALTESGLVIESRLTFYETPDDSGHLLEVNLVGRIECAEGVNIDVDKTLNADRTRTRVAARCGWFDASDASLRYASLGCRDPRPCI